MNKLARLDSDGNAKPLTEIIAHYPNDQKCRGPVPADDARLVYRLTIPSKREVEVSVRDQYIARLMEDMGMYRRQAERSTGEMIDRSEDMANQCAQIASIIASDFMKEELQS